MVERICPACQRGNPLENRFCGSCGASLERQLPAPQAGAALSLPMANLPVPWKQMGKTVALGLASLAAEAGMAWLRRKIDTINVPASNVPTSNVPAQTHTLLPAVRPAPSQGSVTIVSQRTVEIWDQGSLTRHTVERTFWRKEQS